MENHEFDAEASGSARQPVPAIEPASGGQLRDRSADPGDVCSPRELFRGLFLDLEEHPHYLEPAYRFARHAIEAATRRVPTYTSGDALIETLVAWARGTIEPVPISHSAPSWPARVAREFAPVGMSDGAWLRGAACAPALEDDLRECLLEQFSRRLGAPAYGEGYPHRYASLLQSLGFPAASIVRWEWEETSPCNELSYEHALLGLCLGLFPAAFLPEAVGFDLWMSMLGPAPLLQRLATPLLEQGANLRYMDRQDRPTLVRASKSAALKVLSRQASGGDDVGQRLASGFVAAHNSYLRWERAMMGPNVPFTPWDCVLDMVRRKARFAADHHRNVRLAKRSVEDLLRDGGAAHEWLVERLASSPLICPGKPDASRFMSHSLSIEGPMFDAFTAREKVDLRAWIEGIGTRDEVRTTTPAVALWGAYGPAPDLARLEASALQKYGSMTEQALYSCFAEPAGHPGLGLYARARSKQLLDALEDALTTDPRLNASRAPAYSDDAVVALIGRAPEPDQPAPPPRHDPAGDTGLAADGLRFCSVGLYGFGDPRRSEFDDYRWMFHGYGCERRDPAPAHTAGPERGTAPRHRLMDGLLSRADAIGSRVDVRRLFVIGVGLALNTSFFMPELLGLTLGAIAASPASRARTAAVLADANRGTRPNPDGWAVWATYGFVKRVRAVSPSAAEAQWQRIWRAWRAIDILTHGSDDELAALVERLRLRSPS